MSKHSFRFKQFVVRQDKAAMKVGTDGVLLGAWVNTDGARRALDVGTGTGVIALMIAQRSPHIEVCAIDIEPEAYLQASENIAHSPWPNRIKALNITFQQFASPIRPYSYQSSIF